MGKSLVLLLTVFSLTACGGGNDGAGGSTGAAINDGSQGAKQPTNMILTSIQPKSGGSGDQIKLTGSGLFIDKIKEVRFGAINALIVAADDKGFELIVQAPAQPFGFANPITVKIEAHEGGVTALTGEFTYTENINCTQSAAQPQITLINETNLNQNAIAKIFGENFSGDVNVNIAGQPVALTSVSMNAVVALLPDNIIEFCNNSFPCQVEVNLANGNGCADKGELTITKQGVPFEAVLNSTSNNFGSDLLLMEKDSLGDGIKEFAVLSTNHLDVYAATTTSAGDNIWGKDINHISSCQEIATSLAFQNRLYTPGDIDNNGASDLAIVANLQGVPKRMVCLVSAAGNKSDFISANWPKVGNWGAVMQTIGDLDNDDRDDFMVLHSFYENTAVVPGRLELYLGKYFFDGNAANNTAHKSFIPPSGNMQGFGNALANLGDLNGDGYDEIAIAAYAAGAGASFAGSVFIYSIKDLYNAPTWTVPPYLKQITIGLDDEYFGIHMTTIADLDGDGFKDLLIGARSAAVYVYSSKTLLTTSSPQPIFKISPNNMGLFATRIADAGDVNGDGTADIMISSTSANNQMGAVQVYSGKPDSSNNATPLFGRYGADVYSNFGASISTLGDANADGVAEILIGEAKVSGLANGSVIMTNMYATESVYPPF